jgi:hypothetical protein
MCGFFQIRGCALGCPHAKANSQPVAWAALAGFTGDLGSASRNVALAVQRADAALRAVGPRPRRGFWHDPAGQAHDTDLDRAENRRAEVYAVR